MLELFIILLKLAAIGAAINLSLLWAAQRGRRSLWAIGLSLAVISFLAGIGVFPGVELHVELYSYVCGPVCGHGSNLTPFGIVTSVLATSGVLSAAAIRKRRWIGFIVGWVISTVFLLPGVV